MTLFLKNVDVIKTMVAPRSRHFGILYEIGKQEMEKAVAWCLYLVRLLQYLLPVCTEEGYQVASS